MRFVERKCRNVLSLLCCVHVCSNKIVVAYCFVVYRLHVLISFISAVNHIVVVYRHLFSALKTYSDIVHCNYLIVSTAVQYAKLLS
jgi:hypothetical protein